MLYDDEVFGAYELKKLSKRRLEEELFKFFGGSFTEGPVSKQSSTVRTTIDNMPQYGIMWPWLNRFDEALSVCQLIEPNLDWTMATSSRARFFKLWGYPSNDNDNPIETYGDTAGEAAWKLAVALEKRKRNVASNTSPEVGGDS